MAFTKQENNMDLQDRVGDNLSATLRHNEDLSIQVGHTNFSGMSDADIQARIEAIQAHYNAFLMQEVEAQGIADALNQSPIGSMAENDELLDLHILTSQRNGAEGTDQFNFDRNLDAEARQRNIMDAINDMAAYAVGAVTLQNIADEAGIEMKDFSADEIGFIQNTLEDRTRENPLMEVGTDFDERIAKLEQENNPAPVATAPEVDTTQQAQLEQQELEQQQRELEQRQAAATFGMGMGGMG